MLRHRQCFVARLSEFSFAHLMRWKQSSTYFVEDSTYVRCSPIPAVLNTDTAPKEIIRDDDMDPFAAAAWISYTFVYIHPFEVPPSVLIHNLI